MKDTSDFIRKLEQVQIPNNALIITLDYCSMYTNVPHDEALSALRYTLNNNTQHQYVKGVKRPSTDSLCHLAQIILENNTFVFNGQNWKQSLGVAMGVKVSPELCDLTIFRMEKEFLKQCTTDMFLWKRYRDDVFAIWTGSIDAAHQFLNYANSLHKTLKFEYCISPDGANFLDTTIFKGTRFALEGLLDFKPYTKPTETFQYLHRTSAHPPSVFTGLIKGELIRFVRTSTNKCDYLARADLFKSKLLLRGYSSYEFEAAFSSVDHADRNVYLRERDRNSKNMFPLVFVTLYNPHVHGLRRALLKHWSIISNNKLLSPGFSETTNASV